MLILDDYVARILADGVQGEELGSDGDGRFEGLRHGVRQAIGAVERSGEVEMEEGG